MHDGAYRFVESVAGTLPTPGRVLEIGSKNINGSVRPLFPARHYVGLDIVGGPDVDVVGDGGLWRGDAPYDVVVCCEVLEHADNAGAIVRNALDQVAVGGSFVMTCAGEGRPAHSAVDGGPLRDGEYYANVTAAQFEEWVDDSGIAVSYVALTEYARPGDLYAHVRRIA